MLGLITHAADIQDRDGATGVIAQAVESDPSLAHIFADGGGTGKKQRDAMTAADGPTTEIIKRPPGITGFVVIARRRVVGRTFAWRGRYRRLAKDREVTIAAAGAWIPIVAIRRSARHIAQVVNWEFRFRHLRFRSVPRIWNVCWSGQPHDYFFIGHIEAQVVLKTTLAAVVL